MINEEKKREREKKRREYRILEMTCKIEKLKVMLSKTTDKASTKRTSSKWTKKMRCTQANCSRTYIRCSSLTSSCFMWTRWNRATLCCSKTCLWSRWRVVLMWILSWRCPDMADRLLDMDVPLPSSLSLLLMLVKIIIQLMIDLTLETQKYSISIVLYLLNLTDIF